MTLQQSQRPGQSAERAKSIGELYQEQGIEVLSPFAGDRSDVSSVASVEITHVRAHTLPGWALEVPIPARLTNLPVDFQSPRSCSPEYRTPAPITTKHRQRS